MALLITAQLGCGASGASDNEPNRQEFSGLGRKIFFDTTLAYIIELGDLGLMDQDEEEIVAF